MGNPTSYLNGYGNGLQMGRIDLPSTFNNLTGGDLTYPVPTNYGINTRYLLYNLLINQPLPPAEVAS